MIALHGSKNIADCIRAFRYGDKCKSGSVRTDGETFWSYATPIARRVKFPDGREYVEMDCRTFSSTTSRQQYALAAAFHHNVICRPFWEVREGRGSDQRPYPLDKTERKRVQEWMSPSIEEATRAYREKLETAAVKKAAKEEREWARRRRQDERERKAAKAARVRTGWSPDFGEWRDDGVAFAGPAVRGLSKQRSFSRSMDTGGYVAVLRGDLGVAPRLYGGFKGPRQALCRARSWLRHTGDCVEVVFDAHRDRERIVVACLGRGGTLGRAELDGRGWPQGMKAARGIWAQCPSR